MLWLAGLECSIDAMMDSWRPCRVQAAPASSTQSIIDSQLVAAFLLARADRGDQRLCGSSCDRSPSAGSSSWRGAF